VMPAQVEPLMNYNSEVDGEEVFLYYRIPDPVAPGGSLTTTFAVCFPCNDSCANSSYSEVIGKEAARDSSLEMTLESRTADDIRTPLCTSRLKLWIKSNVNKV